MSATLAPPRPARGRPTHQPKVVCKLARRPKEREAAFRLTYQRYLEAGLTQSNRYGMRVTPFQLRSTSNMFLATRSGRLISTVTLVGDSDDGLPMESIFPEEVGRVRAAGYSIGEVSCLATTSISFKQFLPLFVSLMRLMAQHARLNGMDRLLVAAHPRHGRFYQRMMGFEVFGDDRPYPAVQGAPATAFCLDFDQVDAVRPPLYDEIFGERIPIELLEPCPPGEIDFELFEPLTRIAEQNVYGVL